MSCRPMLPVPMTPTVMRLLGATLSSLPRQAAGMIRGAPRAPRNCRRVARKGSVMMRLSVIEGASPSASVFEVADHLIHVHDVPEVDVDVQEEDVVHQLAAFAHRLAWDDDPKAAGGVAAGGVHAMTGADAQDDQRVHPQ